MENALKKCNIHTARGGGCRYYNDNMGLIVGRNGEDVTSVYESSWWKRSISRYLIHLSLQKHNNSHRQFCQ